MSTARTSSLLARTLYGGIVVLLLVLVLEVLYFVPDDSAKASLNMDAERFGQTLPVDPGDSADRETFQIVVDRSLFSWNRRPVVAEQKLAQVEDADIEKRWELSGVVAAGDTSYVMFRSLEDAEALRLEPGMYLEKWRVEEITSELITLSADDEEKQFRLKEQTTDSTPANGKGRVSRRVRKSSSTPRAANKVSESKTTSAGAAKPTEEGAETDE